MIHLVLLIAFLSVAIPAGSYQGLAPVQIPMFQAAPPPDLSAVPVKYRQVIIDAAARYDIPARILAGIASAESDFTPAPAHRDPLDEGMFGIREAPGYHEERAALYGEYDAEDPEQAARVAAGILANHLARFGYVPAAISAYHRGAGWVEANGIDWKYVERVMI